jgi:hypothetical protein
LSKVDLMELTFIIDEVSRISSVSDHAIRVLRRATGLTRKHAGHLKTPLSSWTHFLVFPMSVLP